jgi:hypothetical protein
MLAPHMPDQRREGVVQGRAAGREGEAAVTKGRRNLKTNRRIAAVQSLRKRDGDTCVHCGEELDFTIHDKELPGFVTVEHHPIPWRECRSHDLRWLRLAHRFCNESNDMIERIRSGEAHPRALTRYVHGWLNRAPPQSIPPAALERAQGHLAQPIDLA